MRIDQNGELLMISTNGRWSWKLESRTCCLLTAPTRVGQ